MAGKVILKNAIKREKGKLYFLDKEGSIRETKMARGATKGHKTCKAPKAKTVKGKTSKKGSGKQGKLF
jgi:hypothetical protein